jgi:hypothetical protein
MDKIEEERKFFEETTDKEALTKALKIDIETLKTIGEFCIKFSEKYTTDKYIVIHSTGENKIEGWEEKFKDLWWETFGGDGDFDEVAFNKLEYFVRQLLADQEKEHQEKLERIKEKVLEVMCFETNGVYKTGEDFLIGIDKVLEIISKEIK